MILGIHGAFRGGWMWEPTMSLLAGHSRSGPSISGSSISGSLPSFLNPTLLGMDPDVPIDRPLTLEMWVEQLADLLPAEMVARADQPRIAGRPKTDGRLTLVGHSMGGVVAQELALRLCESPRLILIDSPLIYGQRSAVELSSETAIDPAILPPPSTMIPATPVGEAQGYNDAALRSWVNDRLVATPMGPQLNPTSPWNDSLERTIVFCDRTPSTYPSAIARRRCDQLGISYTLIDADHDVPIVDPSLVVELLE